MPNCTGSTLDQASPVCQLPLLFCHLYKANPRVNTAVGEPMERFIEAFVLDKTLRPDVNEMKSFFDEQTGVEALQTNSTCEIPGTMGPWGFVDFQSRHAQLAYSTLFGNDLEPIERVKFAHEQLKFDKGNHGEYLNEVLRELGVNHFEGFLEEISALVDKRLGLWGLDTETLALFWNVWPNTENNLREGYKYVC